jgi:hypothetical protein
MGQRSHRRGKITACKRQDVVAYFRDDSAFGGIDRDLVDGATHLLYKEADGFGNDLATWVTDFIPACGELSRFCTHARVAVAGLA